MKHAAAIALLGVLAGCQPPPTDADLARGMAEEEAVTASEPIASPDFEGAVWALSPNVEGRIIYGIPGEAAQVALECVDAESQLPKLVITRLAPADEGAGAMLALVGNGHIGRLPVDATDMNGRSVWQGTHLAADSRWEPLAGPRKVTLTVPGAGMVTLNPSLAAWDMVARCRGDDPPPQIELPEPEASAKAL